MKKEEITFTDEEIKNFEIICNKINNLVKQLVDDTWNAMKPTIDNISKWLEETQFTKTQFIQILHDLGYSFDDARKIAWKYQTQEGKYTLKYYLIEKQKKEEMDNVAKH